MIRTGGTLKGNMRDGEMYGMKWAKKIHGYTTPCDSTLVFSKKGEYFGSLLLKVFLTNWFELSK